MARSLVARRVAGLLALICLAAPAEVLATSGSGLDEQPVIRRQLMLRGSRHELGLDLGATLADSFVRNYMVGASYQYYFDNWIGAGLSLSGNMCQVLGDMCRTALADDVEKTNSNVGKLQDLSTFGFIVMPYLTVVPISGKFGMFHNVFHYDAHVIAGGAMVTVGSLDSGGKGLDDRIFGPVIGVGEHFFIDDSIAITVSLKDIILNRVLNYTSDQKPADAQYQNNFVLALGVNFYLPGEAKVSH